jgi:two-component system CheB/CheR fusion protein
MVQDPSDAKFDSMPRNAIDSVAVDIVAPAKDLPSRLTEFLKHVPVLGTEPEVEVKDRSSLEKVINMLKIYTGNDFSLYKKNTLYRRIERRMGVHKIDKIASYVGFMQENPKELELLFQELLIGVTSFFRDIQPWEILKEKVIPEVISKLRPGQILRAWIPGCSTGEEAYSLAIIFKEVVEKINPHGGFSLQIFATDLDNGAIEQARKGIFSTHIAENVSPERLKKYFLATDDGYFISTEIRETVVFAQHNIIMHPPFTKIDFLFCRNLLIYLEPELQKKLLGLFYHSLNPDGIMLLGSSETLGTQNNLFTIEDSKHKIYRRASKAVPDEKFDYPVVFSEPKIISQEKQEPHKLTLNIQSLTDRLMLQQFSPAGVLVNEEGDIIYISGHTGRYLEPAVGKANMNIFAMLREGIRFDFPFAFKKAIMKKETVVLRDLRISSNGSAFNLNISIEYLINPEPLNGMIMIVFTEVLGQKKLKPHSKNSEVTLGLTQSEMESELEDTREKMKLTLEEMQTSQEELKSANEELQFTNEELQSTNEEVTSSKEEMQSMNEELQTLNAELQSKVDDYSRVNNDMKNLLNSTEIATLFLDKDLKIRRYTFQATKIFKLIKGDIGRPITDLVSDLIYPGLASDARTVLKTLDFIKKQMLTTDSRWYSIRIMPYRTLDDKVDGVVITFFNITDLKEVEVKLHETEQVNSLLLNSSSDIIIQLTRDLKIVNFNPQAEKYFGEKHKNVLNQSYIQTFIPVSLRRKTQNTLKKYLNGHEDGKLKIYTSVAGGKEKDDEWSVIALLNNQKVPTGLILLLRDIN